MANRLRVLDLFSGIGGISLGLERTGGFETVAFCEIEPFPREVLAHHWPGVPIHGDVRTLTTQSVPGGVDVICGGFPCQPFSVAGKQKAQADERHLWPHFARLIREFRPRWVLAENVPGIRTLAADEVIQDLEAAGYTCWPLVVGADDVGASHRRKRVWFVAHRGHDQPEVRKSHDGLAGERAPFGGWAVESARTGASGGVGCGDRSTRAGEHRGASAGNARDVAHRDRSGSAASRDDADGRGARADARPEGRRPRDAVSESGHALACSTRGATARVGESPTRALRNGGRPPATRAMVLSPSPCPEQPLGSAVDGLPKRLARRVNRESLKALGNSVVPQVVEGIGYAILEVESGQYA